MPDNSPQPPQQPQQPLPEWMKISLASTGGMASSFAAFLVFTAMQSGTAMRGQLVAGDPAVNRQYPTTLGSMQASLTGENAIAGAMSSYVWWIGVVIGGVVLTWVFLRLLQARRA